MTRTVKSGQTGRAAEREARIAKARQRRLELDKDRAARDARVDQAVADAYLAQDERAASARSVKAADVKIGAAIMRILAEGMPLAQAADLLELTANHAQKLKATAVEAQPASGPVDKREPSTTSAPDPPTLTVAPDPGRTGEADQHERTAR